MLNRQPGPSSLYSQSPLKPPKYPAPNQTNLNNPSNNNSISNHNNTYNNNNNNNSNIGPVAVSSLTPLNHSSSSINQSLANNTNVNSSGSSNSRSLTGRKTSSPSFGPSSSSSSSSVSTSSSSSQSSASNYPSSYSQSSSSALNGIDARRRGGDSGSSPPSSSAWPTSSISNRNFNANPSSYSSFKPQSSSSSSSLLLSSSYVPRKTSSSSSTNGSRKSESPTPNSPTLSSSWEEEGREEERERNGQSSAINSWIDYENSSTTTTGLSNISSTSAHSNLTPHSSLSPPPTQSHSHGRPHIPAHSISYTPKDSLTSPSPSPSFSSQPTPSTIEKELREGKSGRDPNIDLDFGLDLKKFGLDDLSDDEGGNNSQQSTGTNESSSNELSQSSTTIGNRSDTAKESVDTTIHMLSLLYDPPVESCELKPYVSILEPSTSTSRSHVTAITADNTSLVNFVWSRGDRRICAIPGCGQGATMQCLTCLKLDISINESYFCTEKCWKEGWLIHRVIHAEKAEKMKKKDIRSTNNKKEEEKEDNSAGEAGEGKNWYWPSWSSEDGLNEPHSTNNSNTSSTSISGTDDPSSVSIYCKFPSPPVNKWVEVSRERVYTPSTDDIGCTLRLECGPVNKPSSSSSSSHLTVRVETGPTLPTPPLPPARPIIYNDQHTAGNATNIFKIVDYNILAQVYATRQLYPYTPIWALQWEYRKNRILAELLQYNADIVCLQEVQANVFDDFFLPQLNAAGYDGMYKRKTRESTTEDANTIDGCATFYKRDRFTLVEQYGIEYNEAARQQTMDRKSLRRLMKGNIALVVVLEENTPSVSLMNGMMRRSRKKRVCIANTHMYWDPEFADVKLWQTYILCQELEKLVLHRNLPLVLCGDFNSLVESSVYELLVTQSVEVGEDVYGVNGVGDICHILPQRHAHNHHNSPVLTHHLALTSAYAGIGEPKYTNFTGHFVGVLDYVFFSRRHLRWVSVMEVEEERRVRQYTALPSPLYASDHLPLIVEMEWMPEM